MSAGALPMNIETQRHALGVDSATANFAASFGMSIGQNGCAGIYPAMLATIIAPTVGINVFSPEFVVMLVAVIVVSSLRHRRRWRRRDVRIAYRAGHTGFAYRDCGHSRFRRAAHRHGPHGAQCERFHGRGHYVVACQWRIRCARCSNDPEAQSECSGRYRGINSSFISLGERLLTPLCPVRSFPGGAL